VGDSGSDLDTRWGVGEKSVGVSREQGAGGPGTGGGGWPACELLSRTMREAGISPRLSRFSRAFRQ
jgi:hypothetical protein